MLVEDETMALPSWLSLELVLGIVGSVTGVLGLAIQALRFKREKPKIIGQILDATHTYHQTKKEEKNYDLTFQIVILLRNKGGGALTIGYPHIILYLTKQAFVHPESIFFPEFENADIRVAPNDLIRTRVVAHYSSSYDKMPKQEEIRFLLVLRHAHGAIKSERSPVLKGTSRLSTQENSQR